VQELKKVKKKTSEINEIRSKYLLPGTRLIDQENYCHIPIVLVKNTMNSSIYSSNNGNLFDGWDLIVPQNWSMAFWLPLVHSGARAIGQNELKYLEFESGVLQYPVEYSDSLSSKHENNKLSIELYNKYLRKPPSKRPNYLKLAFLTPFYCPWKSIVLLNNNKLNEKSLEDAKTSFYVLKNKKLLNNLSTLIFNKNKQAKHLKLNITESELDLVRNSYVAVRLTSLGKGTIDKYSLIYPAQMSLKKNLETEAYNERIVVNNLLSEYRENFLKNLVESSQIKLDADEKKSKDLLNKLLRTKFNKFDLLQNEEMFYKFNVELMDTKTHALPVGFVTESGFTLVNGKYGANAFILTKYFVGLLNDNSDMKADRIQDRINVTYKIPNSNLYREARINHFFI
jgi:hypothetical protein